MDAAARNVLYSVVAFDAYSGERDHAFRRIVIMDSE